MPRQGFFILCVDDDETNNELVQGYLEGSYEVACVTSGQQCLDFVSKRKPDLILLDIMMPVMDGKETCKILRSSAATKEIPIIVVSAKSYGEDLAEMYHVGANGYITKPFSVERLLKVIDDFLN